MLWNPSVPPSVKVHSYPPYANPSYYRGNAVPTESTSKSGRSVYEAGCEGGFAWQAMSVPD